MDTLESMPADIELSVWRERLSGILFVALMAAAVMQIAALPAIRNLGLSPLVVGIVCGMVYGNFLHGAVPAAWNAGVNFPARRLLRIAVAFYGLHISVQQIINVGLPGLTVSVAIVTSTLVLSTVLGQRLLGLDRGSAICGAAAVLALEPTLRAAPHKSTVAVATLVLFGTLSMFFYPLAYRLGWLSLDTQALGIFIGGTIHEVAQVVGAASNIDPATTQVATIVKMTRVALLVPVLLVLSLWLRSTAKRAPDDRLSRSTAFPVPWFAFGFLALALLNSTALLITDRRRANITRGRHVRSYYGNDCIGYRNPL
jgi:uncharacterized integral membrane protein (TIGR00698 family)